MDLHVHCSGLLHRFTKELSKILQKSSLDVVTAEAEIKLVQQTLEGVRQSGDDVFHEVFECMAKKAIIGKLFRVLFHLKQIHLCYYLSILLC
jgi:hypothetical protein